MNQSSGELGFRKYFLVNLDLEILCFEELKKGYLGEGSEDKGSE